MSLNPALQELLANANQQQKWRIPSLMGMPITHKLIDLALARASPEELEQLIRAAIDDEVSLSLDIARYADVEDDQ